jgi:hypothetical protein
VWLFVPVNCSTGCVANGFACVGRGPGCDGMTGASEEGEAGNKGGVGTIVDVGKEGSFSIVNRSATLGKR